MSKIYTRTGDKGQTGLIGGNRVPKNHIRVEAYGTVDEANSFLGLLLARLLDARWRVELQEIQRILFSIGALLADPHAHTARPTAADVEHLEQQIDQLSTRLPQLNNFILPGGSELAALAHLTRTVVRRAERRVITVSQHQDVPSLVIVYLNRLSDYLFVVARAINHDLEVIELPWPNTRENRD